MGKGRFALTEGQRQSHRGRPPKPEEDRTWFHATALAPSRPMALAPLARQEWERIAKYLVAIDRLSALDRQSLTVYCMSWGEFARAFQDELGESASLVTDDFVTLKMHPSISTVVRYAQTILDCSIEFGMTARSRHLEGTGKRGLNNALKLLQGNRSKVAEGKLKGSIIPMLPEWEDEDIAAPEWMTQGAKEEFARLGQELSLMDLFTPIDYVPLCISACLYDLYVRCHCEITTTTVPIYSKKGEEIGFAEHPMHKASRFIYDAMKQYWQDYGQTPRARRLIKDEKRHEKTKTVPLIFTGAKPQ